MKKRLLIAAGILLCLSVGTLGTLTYFTTEEKAHNVITSGNIDIELNEWSLDDTGNQVPFENVDGVMPGEFIDKIVEIKNTGTNPAWVRISVEKAIELSDKENASDDLSLIELDIDTKNWTEQDGYYYYNSILEPGAETEPLFTTVTFAEEMGNLYQESKIEIDIQAQATQVANNGESALEALGWPTK